MLNVFKKYLGDLLLFLSKYIAQNKLVFQIAIVMVVLALSSDFAYAVETTTKPTGGGTGPLFGELIDKGAQIFNGMRDIIYVVSGLGIIAVAIGGFFGNLNWKWLSAIIIGLMVIGLTGGIISYISGENPTGISDTLK